MGVNAGSASLASFGEAYLDAVSLGEGVAAAERYFHPDVVYIVNGPASPVDGLALPSLSARELGRGRRAHGNSPERLVPPAGSPLFRLVKEQRTRHADVADQRRSIDDLDPVGVRPSSALSL